MFVSALVTWIIFMMIAQFVLILLACLFLQSFGEWIIHKFVLHGLGKKKNSFFHHHWLHHRFARKNENEDVSYFNMLKKGKFDSLVLKEAASILLINLLISGPLFLFGFNMFAMCFVLTTWYYFFVHAYSHVNIEFGKKWIPWHYDHHFFDQNENWGVTTPVADWILKTRKKAS